MQKFRVRLVGGWCGNRMVMIRDNIFELLSELGYDIKLDEQSIWENNAPPVNVDLVLQLIEAFSVEELPCPSLNVRPFLKDLNHRETIDQIISAMEMHYPNPPIVSGVSRQVAGIME